MRPLAMLAGGFAAFGAMGIAQAQTIQTAPPAALLQTPLKLPENPAAFANEQRTFRQGGDLVRQSITEVTRQDRAGSLVTLRIVEAQSARTPAGYASLIDPARSDDRQVDVEYERAWPSMWNGAAGRYQVDVTPRAGFGYGAAGGSIGGGATVRLMSPRTDAKVVDRLGRMGVVDGDRYGDAGRWYLFAAGSGRAVGFNMTPGHGNAWTTDPAALVADAQVGLGWRKGDTQTSVGYMVRRVRVNDRFAHQFTDVPSSDQVVGLSFSYKPQPR